MNIFNRLIDYFNDNSGGDVYREVIGQLLLHIHELDNLTIYDMAELCYTSPTTFSRLSKKLGYSNFSEFKNTLCSSIRGYSGLNRIMPFMPSENAVDTAQLYLNTISNCLQQCYNHIDPLYFEKVVLEMGRFVNVHFYSSFTMHLNNFQQDLLLSGKKSIYYKNIPKAREHAKTLDHSSMIVAIIPKLDESIEMIDVLKHAKKAGASVLLLCAFVRSHYEKYADYVISFDGTGTAIDVFSFYYCINLLTMLYRKLYND